VVQTLLIANYGDTEFDGGVYHGRIVLPTEYPHKPPDFYFATPNGRFALEKKVCLTISSHHAESWQPSWGSMRRR
jgi:ubiquitin-conjugating enzyme E2 J1